MLKQAESAKFAILFAVLLMLCSTAAAQTTVNGNSLAYKSTGSASGSAWNLDRNGYVGTYITLASPGTVTIKVNATGTAGSGIAPNVSVAIADSIRGFSVGGTTADYSQQFTLPAGTHFVRTQFDNDLALTARQVKINSLTVTGASVANSATSANALAASDTYIANYRKGNATVQLGLPAGTQVQVRLKKLAFAWGTVAPGSGSGVNNYLGSSTQATNYKARLLANFNALGMENAGKWNDTESTRGKPTMAGVDAILNFAAANNLTARAHTLAYDLDQNDPSWVNSLRSKAVSSSSAKTDLRNAISSRISYYATPQRMANVEALDVFNESLQSQDTRGKSSYYSLFGASGFASVFDELNRKMGDATTKLYVNEYNSLIYPYGNAAGYLPHIENLQRAGTAVEGIGTQHYPWSLGMHSPSDILKAMQTYNVTGLPQTITELGAYTDNGLTSSQAATILGDVMRLAFGNPNSTGVYLWGFHRENGGGNLFAPGLALYDVNTRDWSKWTLTAAGKVWQDRLAAWTTNTTATVDATGAVRFNGFYGDYELVAGGKTYTYTHAKSVGLANSGTPEPSALVLVAIAAVCLIGIRWR